MSLYIVGIKCCPVHLISVKILKKNPLSLLINRKISILLISSSESQQNSLTNTVMGCFHFDIHILKKRNIKYLRAFHLDITCKHLRFFNFHSIILTDFFHPFILHTKDFRIFVDIFLLTAKDFPYLHDCQRFLNGPYRGDTSRRWLAFWHFRFFKTESDSSFSFSLHKPKVYINTFGFQKPKWRGL